MNVNEVMLLCYEEPEIVHTVLGKATDFLIQYIKEFKRTGANGIIMQNRWRESYHRISCRNFLQIMSAGL